MTRLITSALSPKAQLTLPKEVRSLLGVGEKEEQVGFLIDTGAKRVTLVRVETVVADADFSNEEVKKLLKLRGKKGGKSFGSISNLLKDLKA